MTHKQLLDNHSGTIATLFQQYGINKQVNASNLEYAMITHPSFAEDLAVQTGSTDNFENLFGRKRPKANERKAQRQEKRAVKKDARKQKKTDKANGIKLKGVAGMLNKFRPKANNLASTVQDAKDGGGEGITTDGNLTSDVQEVQDTGSKQSTIQKIGSFLNGASDIAGGVGNVIDKLGGGPGGAGGGEEYYNDGGNNTATPTAMDWLKANWYIPAIVVVVIVVAVIALRPSKKASK